MNQENGMNLSIDLYNIEESSDCPEIINGVLASSIKIESTSSTIAKLNGL